MGKRDNLGFFYGGGWGGGGGGGGGWGGGWGGGGGPVSAVTAWRSASAGQGSGSCTARSPACAA